MFRKIPLLALALTVLAFATNTASAAEVRAFDKAGFAAAQATGRPILVEVKAWWCPVCASQTATIKQATAGPAYDKLLILEINYDKQKDAWKALGARKQGTLIGFRGKREVGRLEFQTDKDLIKGLLAKTAG